MRSLNLKFGLLCGLFALFTACSHNELFSEFHSFQDASWNQNDIPRFKVEVTDTISRYDIQIEVRNKDNYAYRNLWLFIDFRTPDGNVRKDSINCELADAYGKWHGNGISLNTLTLPYEQAVRYPHSGTYIYSIRQGMRENPLKGISDIGLKVLKKTE